MIKQRRSRIRTERRGAAMVEMALVLPIFFMVVLGIIEFGRAMMVGNLVTNAAREGARMGILDGSTNSQIEAAVHDFLSTSLGVDPEKVAVTITVTPAAGNPDPGNEVASATTRDLVHVHVQVPFNDVALVPGEFLSDKNLVGESAMRHE